MIASRLLRSAKLTRITSKLLFKSSRDMVKRALTEGIPTDVNRIQITVNVSHVTNGTFGWDGADDLNIQNTIMSTEINS